MGTARVKSRKVSVNFAYLRVLYVVCSSPANGLKTFPYSLVPAYRMRGIFPLHWLVKKRRRVLLSSFLSCPYWTALFSSQRGKNDQWTYYSWPWAFSSSTSQSKARAIVASVWLEHREHPFPPSLPRKRTRARPLQEETGGFLAHVST